MRGDVKYGNYDNVGRRRHKVNTHTFSYKCKRKAEVKTVGEGVERGKQNVVIQL